MKRILSLILFGASLFLGAACGSNPAASDEAKVEDTSAQSMVNPDNEEVLEQADTKGERLRQLLSYTSEAHFPLRCGELNPDRSAQVPPRELVQEFIKTDEEYPFHLPPEVPYDWFTGVDASSHAALLGFVEHGAATWVLYGYEWDDGMNEFMGVNMLAYDDHAELISKFNLCEYDQLEKPGMVVDNMINSAIDENGQVVRIFHHSWVEESGMGEEVYFKTVTQINADGTLTVVAEEEGNEEQGLQWLESL